MASLPSKRKKSSVRDDFASLYPDVLQPNTGNSHPSGDTRGPPHILGSDPIIDCVVDNGYCDAGGGSFSAPPTIISQRNGKTDDGTSGLVGGGTAIPMWNRMDEPRPSSDVSGHQTSAVWCGEQLSMPFDDEVAAYAYLFPDAAPVREEPPPLISVEDVMNERAHGFGMEFAPNYGLGKADMQWAANGAPPAPYTEEEDDTRGILVERYSSDKRTMLNVLERARREDLKLSFKALRDIVPDLEGDSRAVKGVILLKASEYIQQLNEESAVLEATVQMLRAENERLRRI